MTHLPQKTAQPTMHVSLFKHSTPQLLRRSLTTLTLACLAVAVSGCAALTPSTPEQAVQKRAADYWKTRVSGELDKAYEFSTPSYRRLRTVVQFNRQFGAGASIEQAEVNKVECEPEKCNVQMKLGVRPAIMGVAMGMVPIYVNEVWVLEDGKWWRYQDV